MTCRTGCPTKDCRSYAECLRGSGVRVGYSNSANGWDRSRQKHWDGELSRYRDLQAQGIDPIGTTHREMDRSERVADFVTQHATTDD